MKGRSDRLPTSEPPDDWVNGSWTVDCICGVNFDDGEEMVNCDECGVWVHTRCSRFVKGEKSFACDKCKSKVSRNDSEETEVAQLLVELPTKTIKLNNPYPLTNPPSSRPYKLWTDRPIEQRVHVQGIPGGDPAIFQGFSSIFSSELWKCTGYIPKKFNFCYREFPCWDKQQDIYARAEGGTETTVDKGAGVLYSLSKETAVAACAPVLVSMRNQIKVSGSDKKASRDRKWEGGDSKNSGVQNLAKEEKLPALVLHCGKRSREDLVPLKNRTGKKKSKVLLKEHSSKGDKAHALKTELCDSKAQKFIEADAPDDMHGLGNDAGSQEVAPNPHLTEISSIEKPPINAAADKRNLAPMSSEVSELGCSRDKRVEREKLGQAVSDRIHKSANTDVIISPSPENGSIMRNSMKKEELVLDDVRGTYRGAQTKPPSHDIRKSKHLVEDVANATLEIRDTEIQKNLETNMVSRSAYFKSKAESEAVIDNPKAVLRVPSFDDAANSDGMKDLAERTSSADHESDNFQTDALSCQSCEHKGQEGDKGLAVSGCQYVKDDKTTDNSCNTKLEYDGSESSLKVPKILSHSKVTPRVGGEMSKMTGSIASLPSSVSAGKSPLSSSSIVISRSFVSDKNRRGFPHDLTAPCKRMISSSSLSMKENASVDPIKDEDKHEKPKSTVKGVGEPAASLQTQHALHVQNKNVAPAGQQRGERVPHPNVQSSSKSSQSLLAHLPASLNSPAGLSDEELALLLHQELNSSPRVPRVPRVRHAGSLPQLSSVSATSMLIKRASSSGGKDQHMFSRRKSKDAHRDGYRSCREQDNEARKVDKVPSSPDSAKTSDALTQGEANSELLHTVEKNIESTSTSAPNSGPFSSNANELKFSSNQDLLSNSPEDDVCTNKGVASTPRTLPGLIAEIMGQGKRMTYEELCDAVLPHWQNLRKHNGERYAYSSHSQAVLDCLRNRSEWARLVDRGPKTNASRKKRKIDAEPPYTESEDGEDRILNDGESKSFKSNKEEFRKGKRKARTRRRTSLPGRGAKDDMKRRKVEAGSDDLGSSSFSDGSMSTEDESQGSGLCPAKSEVSANSDGLAAVS